MMESTFILKLAMATEVILAGEVWGRHLMKIASCNFGTAYRKVPWLVGEPPCWEVKELKAKVGEVEIRSETIEAKTRGVYSLKIGDWPYSTRRTYL